ncbi:MAG: hypothetical protein QOE33_2910 [Acidobacteriota bacterium]|nr:hypothetical protein [Acidobacteriota bacterium]
MSLNGQLSDLHLSELIEFFCNQRKTGRLKIDYALAPGVFFMKEGELIDAKVGALNGKDAVFFALTLPSAAFDFNAGVQSSRRTINDQWASVVLEGLRRIDEGAMPEFDVFGGDDELDAATREYLDCIEESKARADAQKSDDLKISPAPVERDAAQSTPLSMTVEATHNGGGKSKAMIACVVAALVLLCLVAAIPISRHFARKDAPAATPIAQPAATTNADTATDKPMTNASGDAASATGATSATDTAATEEAARHEQQQHDVRERARKLQREEAAKNAAQDQTLAQGQALAPAAKPTPSAPAGAKSVRVQISYDEAGRVTQAAAIGTSPGAEAYAATAVRAARGRHFTPGKAGTTVVTIPIN